MVRIIQPLLTEDEEEALMKLLQYLADEENEYAALSPEGRSNHIFRSVLTLRACGLLNRQRFEGGRTFVTPGAAEALEQAKQEPSFFLGRHFAGDWGEVGLEDWTENQLSLENGFRLLSTYLTATGERLWVITEADRSMTTLLIPEEY